MEKYSNCTQYYSLKIKTDNTNDPVTEQYPAGKHQVLTFMWMWLRHVPHVLQQCCWACTIPSITKATLSSGKLSQQDTTLHPQRPKTAARRIQIFCWQCPRARQHRTPSGSLCPWPKSATPCWADGCIIVAEFYDTQAHDYSINTVVHWV